MKKILISLIVSEIFLSDAGGVHKKYFVKVVQNPTLSAVLNNGSLNVLSYAFLSLIIEWEMVSSNRKKISDDVGVEFYSKLMSDLVPDLLSGLHKFCLIFARQMER